VALYIKKPEPMTGFIEPMEKTTRKYTCFGQVLFSGKYSQLVVMSFVDKEQGLIRPSLSYHGDRCIPMGDESDQSTLSASSSRRTLSITFHELSTTSVTFTPT
jgi:hypothetical protein